MIRGASDGGVNAEILHRLHVEGGADDTRYFPLNAADDLACRQAALGKRLQVDEEPPGIRRLVGAVDADERAQAFDIAILQNRLGKPVL